MTKNYFAFGSNLFARRLCQRIPSAKVIGTYTLPAHVLRFHKRGEDGSGKCDAYFTDNQHDSVIGRLFAIACVEIAKLDRCEGLGKGYEKKEVHVINEKGETETAFTYYADSRFIDNSIQPFSWYKQHVVAGAKEGGLPAEYIEKIETVPTQTDSDSAREKKQMALHQLHKPKT